MNATTLPLDTAGQTNPTETRERERHRGWTGGSRSRRVLPFRQEGLIHLGSGPMLMLLSRSSHWNEHILYTMYLLHCTHDFSAHHLSEPCLVGGSSSAGHTLRVHHGTASIDLDFTNCFFTNARGLRPPLAGGVFALGEPHPSQRMRTHTASPRTLSSNQFDSTVRWPSGLRR